MTDLADDQREAAKAVLLSPRQPRRARRPGRLREDHHAGRPGRRVAADPRRRRRPGALGQRGRDPVARPWTRAARRPPSGSTSRSATVPRNGRCGTPTEMAVLADPHPTYGDRQRRERSARRPGRGPGPVAVPPRGPGHRRRGLDGRHPHPGGPRRPGRRGRGEGAARRRPPATRRGRRRRRVRDARPPRPDRRAAHPVAVPPPVGSPRHPRPAPRRPRRPGRLRSGTAGSATARTTTCSTTPSPRRPTPRPTGRTVLLAAADRRTVNELNARTRAERIRTGTVRTTGITLSDGLTGGVGDRIVTRRNNRRLRTSDGFVRNGDLWTITDVLPDGGLRVRPVSDPAGGTAAAARARTSPRPSSSATPPPPPAARA